MQILKVGLAAVASWAVAFSAAAATFSFEFAYDGPGIPQLPGSIELVTNDFVITDVRVFNPTKLEIYRVEQARPAALAAALGAPNDNVDLLFGGARFDIVQQNLDLAGQLVGNIMFVGSFFNSLGLGFNDPDFGDVFLFYADIPFRFFVDNTAEYDGLPGDALVGGSDVVWFQLPNDTGLYRLQAAAGVPEPTTWALMILGFGAAGVALRRRGFRGSRFSVRSS